jgi:hypothetical protein
MNLQKGSITVTGPNAILRSSGIYLNNVNMGTLALDQVQQVIAVGGIWDTLITTANTTQRDLRPGYLVDRPTFNATDSSLCVGVLAAGGGGPIWAVNQDLTVLTNNNPRLVIRSTGSVNLAPGGTLATNARDGFTYIPTCAGVPTGVPSIQTGSVAMVYDTANNSFYIYNGAWKKVSLT